MNPNTAAEKISDLFQVTLSELETNLVSSAIKFGNQPQKLVEELQCTVTEFKQRFYESLNHLLQFIAQICGSNGKDVLKIAQEIESQVTRFKQQQLLLQMKQVVNSKLKALMDTFCHENQCKSNIQNQIHHLKESLSKIESTLLEQNFQTSQYITPYPKKNFLTHSSIDMLTPNLSEEAELRARGFFITPEQRQQQPRQFDPSQQQSHSLNESNTQNKTLNSFNKEKSEQKQIQPQTSAYFGQQQQQKLFQNEIMDEYFSRIPLYQSQQPTEQDEIQQQEKKMNEQNQNQSNQFEQMTTVRTETAEMLIEQATSDQMTSSIRNQSAQSGKRQLDQGTPKRLTQTSKAKEPISRCRSSIDSTNLITKLNQAENNGSQTTKNASSRHLKQNSNKENNFKVNQKQQQQQQQQQSKSTINISKPKQLVIKKEQSKKNVK